MRKTLSERLRESWLAEQTPPPAPAINPAPGAGAPAPGAGAPAPAVGAPIPAAGNPAPAANQVQNRYTIQSAQGGSSFIITYVPASKGWCVYIRTAGAPTAKLWAGPLPKLTDAFAKAATGF